jgi:hypothetical protein
MKNIFLFVISLLVFAIILISCEKSQGDSQSMPIEGEVVSYTGCKEFKSTLQSGDYNSSTSCVTYTYDSKSKKLSLKHINAGFNCCPGILYCNIQLSGDSIIITEFEEAQQCYCNCLFDLNIIATGVERENYIIKFDEPYCGDQEKIIFSINLKTVTSGEYCVSRDEYPWGEIM